MSRTPLHSAIHRIFATGKITRQDQEILQRYASARGQLHPTDDRQINKIFRHLNMGLLTVVD